MMLDLIIDCSLYDSSSNIQFALSTVVAVCDSDHIRLGYGVIVTIGVHC